MEGMPQAFFTSTLLRVYSKHNSASGITQATSEFGK